MRWFILLLIFSSCSSRYMTKSSFGMVTVGTSIQLVETQYGRAYDVEECDQGLKKYRYIERIATAPGVTEHIHYIFLVGPDDRILQKTAVSIGGPVDLRVN